MKVSTFLILFLTVGPTCYGSMENSIQLKATSYAGTGCPHDSTTIILNDDHTNVNIDFTQFSIEGGGNNSRGLNRKTCVLSLPIQIPKGFKLGVVQMNWQGELELSADSRAKVTAELFFSGEKGKTITKDFSGAARNDFLLSEGSLKPGKSTVWSPCGETSLLLRINTSLLLMNKETRNYSRVRMKGGSGSRPALILTAESCSGR
jgi:hypothetical protein